MNKFYFLILTLILPIDAFSYSNGDYRLMVEAAARRYGISPSIPMAIIRHESNINPHALNIDGEGFLLNSRYEAESRWSNIAKNPWMVKLRLENNQFYRSFFLNYSDAASWAQKIAKSSPHKPKILEKKVINPSKKTIILRKINVKNTDLGLGQTNYIYHGQKYSNKISFFDWLDPSINIEYTTLLLSRLIKKHKSPIKAMGHYHNKKPKIQSRYLKQVIPLYKEELNRYGK